ncbi:TlpA disulfide reductase family protein, partial [Bacteroidota bacterium]
MNIKSLLVLLLLLPSFIFCQEVKSPPNFVLENLDGDYIELDEYIGDAPILISFWATWCKPCHEEMKYIQEIYDEYNPDGLVVFAVSTDNEKSVLKVKPFVKTRNYSFEVLYDTNNETARDYYVLTVPHTVIIDKEG